VTPLDGVAYGAQERSDMAIRWRIALFGELRAEGDGRVVTRFRRQKTGLLLAYLAYHLPRTHLRDALIELLWPEGDLQAGRHSLSVALSSLRQQLEPPGVPAGAVLVADRASVCLNPAVVTTDVAEFEAALRSAERAGSRAERAESLTRAVDLYRGELLAGYYEEWLLSPREWLAERYFQALGQLIGLLEQSGEMSRALDFGQRGVSADPLREEAHRDLMRLYAAAGQPAAALRQYRELERRLKQELDTSPAAPTRALAREIAALVGGSAAREDEAPGGHPAVLSLPESRPSITVPAAPLPTGTVTFLMTDIEGSTALWQRAGEAFAAALAEHHALLRRLFRRHGGHEVKEMGDSFLVAFAGAADALACAITGQQALAAQAWPEVGAPLRIRMALHTGDVQVRDGDYHGLVLHHTQRMLVAGHGGQILCSEGAAALLRRDLAPGVRLADLGVFRLRDLAMPERLFQVEYPGMAQPAFPPLRAEAGYAGHLPPSFTRFFGRKPEVALLAKLLTSPERRLVTLMGPGGSGKTRLALEVAGHLTQAWHGAVWFVSLAELTEAGRLVETVRDAIGLPRPADAAPLEQVVSALGRQPTLLMLDNFEHLLPEGAPLLRMLLERVPTLTVLVTSRQRLGVVGEREFLVLPLPTPGGVEEPEQLMQCESVQLFVDRAQAVLPDFQITPANAAAVAGVCARLEGIPLALELAAARVGVLTPAQILSRLSQRFELLTRRRGQAGARHESLRATLDWSYQLLSPELRGFFAQLSVFRGGFTLPAAEAVCEVPSALDDLAELRECSLVLAEEVGPGVQEPEMRYRLLETLREYAAEQLTSEEQAAVAQRHARFFLALAEVAEPELARAEQGEWLDRLEREHDNLRAALLWSIDQGEVETGLRLGGALWRFWSVRGHWAEGRERLAQLLTRDVAEGASASWERAAARAKALNAAGELANAQGDYAAARACLEESLAIRQAWGRLAERTGGGPSARPIDLADVLNLLGANAIDAGEYDAARQYLEDALRLLVAEDHAIRGKVLHNFALLASRRGDLAEAQQLYEEALRHRHATGDTRGEADTLANLGVVAYRAGDTTAARRRYRESLALRRSLRDPQGIAMMLNNLGELAELDGDAETAVALFFHAERLFRELQSAHVAAPADALQRLAAQVGEARWKELRGAAEQTTWEEVVQAGEG
jgi:predicted ATPase/DNA-binding SARP family transcriptional activator